MSAELLGRGVAALAVLTGRRLMGAVQYLERLSATPELELHGHRVPHCSRCGGTGHNRRTCSGQLLIPGAGALP